MSKKPVVVSPDADCEEMNELHGEGYGYDWIYPTSDGLAVRPMRHGITVKETKMRETANTLGQAQMGIYKAGQDPMQQMTCGENLERKISELKERLTMLEAVKEEMQKTGLYDVKISTLRDMMSW